MKELAALENERLIEQKKFKEFYTRLSDALRSYMGAAYRVQALDLTSNELLRELDGRAEDEPQHRAESYRKAVARLTELLDEADLVKFARYMPEAARGRRALEIGREIVKYTSYKFEPEPEEKRSGAGQVPPGGQVSMQPGGSQ